MYVVTAVLEDFLGPGFSPHSSIRPGIDSTGDYSGSTPSPRTPLGHWYIYFLSLSPFFPGHKHDGVALMTRRYQLVGNQRPSRSSSAADSLRAKTETEEGDRERRDKREIGVGVETGHVCVCACVWMERRGRAGEGGRTGSLSRAVLVDATVCDTRALPGGEMLRTVTPKTEWGDRGDPGSGAVWSEGRVRAPRRERARVGGRALTRESRGRAEAAPPPPPREPPLLPARTPPRGACARAPRGAGEASDATPPSPDRPSLGVAS